MSATAPRSRLAQSEQRCAPDELGESPPCSSATPNSVGPGPVTPADVEVDGCIRGTVMAVDLSERLVMRGCTPRANTDFHLLAGKSASDCQDAMESTTAYGEAREMVRSWVWPVAWTHYRGQGVKGIGSPSWLTPAV